jgi:uncharacterized protein (DUF433 family)
MASKQNDFADTGLYTVSEASRLTGVSPARVRGWLQGYSQGNGKRTTPKLLGQLPPMDGKVALGFLDLMEVRFISHFLKIGVRWMTLRLAAERARQEFELDHPFATRFISDGRTIFTEVLAATGDRHLRDLVDNQFAMYAILEPALQEGIEFDTRGYVRSWHPSKEQPHVILDPHRSFGRPILGPVSVPTRTLYDAFRAEGSIERVAHWYRVEPGLVQEAVAFELHYAA